MIYEVPATVAPLTQGDIIDRCPIVYWTPDRDDAGNLVCRITTAAGRIVVLTQACDLANAKTSKVQIAIVPD